jgi:CheY-like chemotaxis protein
VLVASEDRIMESSATILLIEEDQELRKVFRDHLEAMGYWVVAVSGTARAPFVDFAAAADLLVADVTVPGSDSVLVTEELLERHDALRALLISTNDVELEVRRRFKDRRTRFLLKPFAIDELRDAVSRALPARTRPSWVAGRPRPRLYAAWGLAAAAVLVLAAGALLSGRGPAPPLPEPAASTVPRGASLRALEPVGDLSEKPARLSWAGLEGAAGYRILILAVDDTILWQGESRAEAVALPPEAVAVLHAGVVYFWTVEALDARGEVLARSAPARFQAVPPRPPEKGERP